MERGEGGQCGDGEEVSGDGGEEGGEELSEEEDGGLELGGRGGRRGNGLEREGGGGEEDALGAENGVCG